METSMNRWMVAVISAVTLFTTVTVSAGAWTFHEKNAEVLKQCQGKFKGRKPTPEELRAVLNDHKAWLKGSDKNLGFDEEAAQSDPRRANLCGAVLTNCYLSKANLSRADIRGANLKGANLSNALLWDTNLSGANLINANLCGASLFGTNLSGVNLFDADLSGAIFSPDDLPDVDEIAFAKNLSEMHMGSPQALIKLRKALKEAGYYQQEREVNYVIQHDSMSWALELRQHRIVDLLEFAFRYVFFDLTCKWGMAPSRALLILLTLIPVFAVPYVIALRLSGQNGIWCKWTDDRIRLDLGTKEPTRLHVGWRRAAALGLYFSVLSAFNIGWRELNVGNWIQRFQAKEYTLKATGWVRTVSGVQSLVSVYLLAIWALTYFGRPFE